MIESFAQLARFPGYQFGDRGSVQSRWKRSRNGSWYADWRDISGWRTRGYGLIRLRIACGVYEAAMVGALVLEAHTGPAPSSAHVCRHLDGDHANCRVENLVWATQAEIQSTCLNPNSSFTSTMALTTW